MSTIKKLVAVIVCCVLTACGGGAHLSGSPITIAQFGHVFVYMPLYVAIDKGFFREQGIDVNLISTGGDEKTFAAVASGNAQFGVSDPTFVAIARERGQGGKVVGAVVVGAPLSVVAYKDIKPIDDPVRFEGYRIATYASPSTSYTLMKQVLKNLGHPINAKIIEGGYGTLQAMVKTNQADMALEVEPMVSIALAQNAHVVYEMNKTYGCFAFTGLMVSDQFRHDHPDQVQAAVTALSRALKFVRTNRAATLQIAKKEFPELSESVIKGALDRLITAGNVPKSAVLERNAWDSAIKLRREMGDLKSSGSFDDNVDNFFASKAQTI